VSMRLSVSSWRWWRRIWVSSAEATGYFRPVFAARKAFAIVTLRW
jgi:hypothetical protein